MKQEISLQKRAWPTWTADALALLGLVIFFIQIMVFAHTTVSNLDEGGYLLKGTLFVSGGYRPFDPGIWTNKAPLSFLIPGFVQSIFGAGLRTGRYLAVFFGVMAVVGTWIAARRLGGKWLAAGAVFVLALSPAVIKMYSGGATQSTIACLIAWVLALSLGENRPTWQLALAGFLAGVMIMVRQNMVPVLPLLALYAFWEHGRKAVWLLICGVLVIAYIHFIYWPDILQLWSWVPLVRLPTEVTYTGGGTSSWTPQIEILSRALAIFQTFRFHFTVLAGSVISILFWPRIMNWKSRADFRAGLFLLVLFWGLVIMHSIATIGGDYCVFCLPAYVAFFNIVGILLLVVSINSWNRQSPVWVQIILVGFFLVIFTGMGLASSEEIGSWLLRLPAPRMRDLRILPGFVTIQDILLNRFGLTTNVAGKYASAAFGLLVGMLVTVPVYILRRRIPQSPGRASFGSIYAPTILALGLLLSPVLNGRAGLPDCKVDVIKSNEQIGSHLKEIIPDGSLVYWDGGLSAAPLLYLPKIKMFPAQINSAYSFINGGDPEQVNEFGFWNAELDTSWKSTAQFFIIEEERYPRWQEFFTPAQFDEYPPSPVGTSCVENTRLRIFRRKP